MLAAFDRFGGRDGEFGTHLLVWGVGDTLVPARDARGRVMDVEFADALGDDAACPRWPQAGRSLRSRASRRRTSARTR